MTLDADRRVGVPMVCPFVAFADERDVRADEPDHRHRCYAEPRPSPRALAHQERYCLSPGFTTCPTFQDWATREAAQVAHEPSAAPSATAAPGLFDEVGAAAIETDDEAAGGEEDREPTPAYLAGAPRGVEPVAWPRTRRRENYPRLRGAGLNLSPLIVGIVALAFAAAALFFLPALLAGMLGGGASPGISSASPSASASPGEPTATPLPTPLVYTVRSGDTLSRIAKKFGVTLDDLIAANQQIKNPDNITVGDKITIPTPSPSATTPAGTSAP